MSQGSNSTQFTVGDSTLNMGELAGSKCTVRLFLHNFHGSKSTLIRGLSIVVSQVSLFPNEEVYHREEIIDFVQSIPGSQECDEDVETWMACDAEVCGFQMLNDDEIRTFVQEESDSVAEETDKDENNNSNESSKGPSNANAFSALDTAMECVQFPILHESHSVFGYPNNRVSELCPVPIDSDKRRSTVRHLNIVGIVDI
ncbi:uncharacterized protein TNCV_717171 [Trichonephila clavipes]|nr:uncharacterized protein TNCV_717171 [Trichonephila clavipes]